LYFHCIYLRYLSTCQVDKSIGIIGRTHDQLIRWVDLGHKSIVARASSNSTSVRATVPEEIVKLMDLKVGDVLDWEVEERKNRKVAIVRKLE